MSAALGLPAQMAHAKAIAAEWSPQARTVAKDSVDMSPLWSPRKPPAERPAPQGWACLRAGLLLGLVLGVMVTSTVFGAVFLGYGSPSSLRRAPQKSAHNVPAQGPIAPVQEELGSAPLRKASASRMMARAPGNQVIAKPACSARGVDITHDTMYKITHNDVHHKSLDFVFTHIGKAGGTSMVAYLKRAAARQCIAPMCWCPVDCRHEGWLTHKGLCGPGTHCLAEAAKSDRCSAIQSHEFFGTELATIARRQNTTEDGLCPLYLSVLREPLSRMVSQYLHGRRRTAEMSTTAVVARNTSLEEYLSEEGYRQFGVEAGPEFNRMTLTICGNAPECHGSGYDGKKALQTAMRNIDRCYIAVGILEEWQRTWKLFNQKLPGWFPMEGLSEVPTYNYNPQGARSAKEQHGISQRTVDAFERLAAQDFELYATILKRLPH